MATLTEIQTLLNEPTLRDKLRAAVVVASKNVTFESAATENHANRLKWAAEVMRDPNGWSERFTRFVVAVHSTSTQAEILALSDAAIADAVALGINTFATG